MNDNKQKLKIYFSSGNNCTLPTLLNIDFSDDFHISVELYGRNEKEAVLEALYRAKIILLEKLRKTYE